MTNKRQIIYTPPDKGDLRRYVRQVSAALAAKKDDSYNDPEIVDGLTEFLAHVAQIEAKQRTASQNGFDNDSTTR